MKMAGETERKDLQRIIEERDYFAFILDAIEGSDDEEDILQEKVLKVMVNAKNRIIDCALNDKPFIAAYFCNAPWGRLHLTAKPPPSVYRYWVH